MHVAVFVVSTSTTISLLPPIACAPKTIGSESRVKIIYIYPAMCHPGLPPGAPLSLVSLPCLPGACMVAIAFGTIDFRG